MVLDNIFVSDVIIEKYYLKVKIYWNTLYDAYIKLMAVSIRLDRLVKWNLANIL